MVASDVLVVAWWCTMLFKVKWSLPQSWWTPGKINVQSMLRCVGPVIVSSNKYGPVKPLYDSMEGVLVKLNPGSGPSFFLCTFLYHITILFFYTCTSRVTRVTTFKKYPLWMALSSTFRMYHTGNFPHHSSWLALLLLARLYTGWRPKSGAIDLPVRRWHYVVNSV